MVGPILVVLVIAHGTGEPLAAAFESAALAALGGQAQMQMRTVAEDPPDAQSSGLAVNADGVVELSWERDGAKARLHCYVKRENRWVDREIVFGSDEAHVERETAERGRLLGFAVATMFGEDERSPLAAPMALKRSRGTHSIRPLESSAPSQPRATSRVLEFSGAMSSGIAGTASGVGAEGAVRVRLHGLLWGRVFVSGRVGNIPAAQATTRTAFFGGGVAFTSRSESRLALGLRADAFATYFDVTHFSDDDTVPDRRSRWLPGGDLIAEAALRLAGSAGVFLGAGVEVLARKTAIYTHGKQVALVAPVRAIAQLGFYVGF